MNKQTTIQISVKHRNMFKDYCKKNGYKMSNVFELIIEKLINNNKIELTKINYE